MDCKSFIQKALRSLPDKFALNEVKSHLTIALSKLSKWEEKKAKKEIAAETTAQRWQEMLKAMRHRLAEVGLTDIGLSNNQASARQLAILEKMIQDQKDKFKDLPKGDASLLNG